MARATLAIMMKVAGQWEYGALARWFGGLDEGAGAQRADVRWTKVI